MKSSALLVQEESAMAEDKRLDRLLAAGACMIIAGMAGGVIASCCTQYESFQELWEQPQGPSNRKWFKGSTWAAIEHTSFWIGAAFLAVAFLVKR
jgi:hypothetical protein